MQLKLVSCGKGIKMLLTHLTVGFMFLQGREQEEENQLRCSVPQGRQQPTLGGVCGGKGEEVVKVSWPSAEPLINSASQVGSQRAC